MPNHIHGIVIIGADTVGGGTERRDAMHRVSTFGPQSKNLASILRGYKSAVTTYARKNNIELEWQPRFHDHNIRNQGEFERISNYIRNNPEKWAEDRFYR
jgi:REP element-mobilizing transposase RayT